jgi:ATP-binding cassette, subfamily B, bacterial PglK
VLTISRVIVNLADLAALALIGLTVAFATGGGSDIWPLNRLSVPTETKVILLSGLAGLLFMSKTLIGVALNKVTFSFLAGVESHLASKIVDWIFGFGISRTRSFTQSEIQWTVLRSSHTAFTGILSNLSNFVSEATLALMLVVLFLITDFWTALGVFVYIALVGLAFYASTRAKFDKAGENYARASVTVDDQILELVKLYKELFALEKAGFFIEKMKASRRDVAKIMAFELWLQSLPRTIIEISLLFGGLLFFFVKFSQGISPGDLSGIAVLLIGSLRLMSALLPLQRSANTLRYIAPQAEAAVTILEGIISNPASDDTNASSAAVAQLSPRNDKGPVVAASLAEVTFGGTQDGVGRRGKYTFRAAPGEFLAVIGPSGSGKSTLLDALVGLIPTNNGVLTIDGRPPHEFRKSRIGAIAYVPQKSSLISGTIRDNLILGAPETEVDHEEVAKSVSRAGLADFLMKSEGGLDLNVGLHADALSGGQIQRLSIARALYYQPDLLLLDEATSALDPDLELSILEGLQELSPRPTIIMVTHRMSAAKLADRIIVIDDGEIIATGTWEELVRNNWVSKGYLDFSSAD